MMHRLDATGLSCPLPVLRAKKALRTLEPGDSLEVRATDPSAPKDFEAFCETTRTILDSVTEEGAVLVIIIRRPA
jgi:tRNA 2-thiouridine synthesizing protein A